MAYSEDRKRKKRLVNFGGTLSTESPKEMKQTWGLAYAVRRAQEVVEVSLKAFLEESRC